ncbi:COG1361 family protein [Actinokineospora bangkokensis]|uniref:DUF11 domain-containing protein n=1 Tax=Actinokineospora bangkokensis TaxID=1193682 RepID=A0A1Q9LEI6_9PSEU|nr:DUF11 domain-containing protein [Actinokineospora bangkokensis]OLR90457.1 hypothetical protein BJP25_27835 [Actinokineospora bangkokensis]
MLRASGPATPPVLTPGAAAPLTLTVRNTGTGPSGPVTATLTLPPGIRATGARAASCGGGSTVTCRGAAIPEGGSATFTLSLLADTGAADGVITGSVGAEGSPTTRFTIPVTVRRLADGVRLVGSHHPGPWHEGPALDFTVRNTGGNPGVAVVRFDKPVRLLASSAPVDCAGNTCTTRSALAPGAEVTFVAQFPRPGWQDRSISATAVLGGATDSAVVRIPWWPGWLRER